MLSCPCRLLFDPWALAHPLPQDLVEEALSGFGLIDLVAQGRNLRNKWQSHKNIGFFSIPRAHPPELLRAGMGLLSCMDVMRQRQNAGDLYPGHVVELTPSQKEVLAKQKQIFFHFAVRRSLHHLLVLGKEMLQLGWGSFDPHDEGGLLGWQTLGARLVLLIVDSDDFGYFSRSERRRRHFSEFLDKLHSQNAPLVLISTTALFDDGKTDSSRSINVEGRGRGSYRDEANRLRFRSAASQNRRRLCPTWEQLLSTDDFDSLLMLLESGQALLQSVWHSRPPFGGAQGGAAHGVVQSNV